MKQIDLKSLIVGGCIVFLLGIQNAPEEKKLEFVPYPLGIAIFDEQTNNLYTYKMLVGVTQTAPTCYIVDNGGASLTEIKKK